MKLDSYAVGDFDRGRSKLIEMIWYILFYPLVASYLPGSLWRSFVLRLFGAKISVGVVIKPRFRVKFPWRLSVGSHSWIGEAVWIDNLAQVRIGSHACISQGAYLCTGSHDWSLESFDLITKPIIVENGAWVGARANVAPGVIVGTGAVLGLGATATDDLLPKTINMGNPAHAIRTRVEKKSSNPEF